MATFLSLAIRCLCDSDISCGTSKVKRKLLSGRAAIKAREVVEGLLLEGHGVGIDDIPILKVKGE